MLVRGAALDSEAALPRARLDDGGRDLGAVGCGAAAPKHDARQQEDQVALQPRNRIGGDVRHRGNTPAAP
jgi:hypothetical protein